jgi:hypothetical protein
MAGTVTPSRVQAQLAALHAVWVLTGASARLHFIQNIVAFADRGPPLSPAAAITRRSHAPIQPSSAINDRTSVVSDFLAERTVVAPGGRTGATEMHAAFCVWAESRGIEPWTIKRLSLALQSHGLRRFRSNTVYWLDRALVKPVGDLVSNGRPVSR